MIKTIEKLFNKRKKKLLLFGRMCDVWCKGSLKLEEKKCFTKFTCLLLSSWGIFKDNKKVHIWATSKHERTTVDDKWKSNIKIVFIKFSMIITSLTYEINFSLCSLLMSLSCLLTNINILNIIEYFVVDILCMCLDKRCVEWKYFQENSSFHCHSAYVQLTTTSIDICNIFSSHKKKKKEI